LLQIVRIAIDFDDQPLRAANQIAEIWANLKLASESMTGQLAC
jgi:hypothetical protein